MFGASPPKPVLVTRSMLEETAPDAAVGTARRSRIWEFNTNLHCSIIGTCLSTGELRQLLSKLGLAAPSATDHDLHGIAVGLAGRQDAAGKLITKALDQRHKVPINQFAKARTEPELADLWRASVRRGEIPGAYWAALTHPAATAALVREAFGDVHMLSHMVGAANRADIRRLCDLEHGKSELEAKLQRQQTQLRDAVVARDSRIQALQEALATRIASEECAATSSGTDATLRGLVADLERRLNAETRRRTDAERRIVTAEAAANEARTRAASAEREAHRLRNEIEAVEAQLAPPAETAGDNPAPVRLDGLSLLYVGGRANQVAHLRTLGKGLGAELLHHDGGVEDSADLLPGLTSRADLVMFPVDCVSHEAALMVKRLCRQSGKRFVPLRSSGATSFLAAMSRPDIANLAGSGAV